LVWSKHRDGKARTSSLQNSLFFCKTLIAGFSNLVIFSLKTENFSIKCILQIVYTVYRLVFIRSIDSLNVYFAGTS